METATQVKTGLFYIEDLRDDGIWTWNGKEFRPSHKHFAKGYKSESVAITRMSRLYSQGYAVGIPRVKQG